MSHVSPIKAAALWAMDADPLLAWRMHLDVASITRVAAPGGRPLPPRVQRHRPPPLSRAVTGGLRGVTGGPVGRAVQLAERGPRAQPERREHVDRDHRRAEHPLEPALAEHRVDRTPAERVDEGDEEHQRDRGPARAAARRSRAVGRGAQQHRDRRDEQQVVVRHVVHAREHEQAHERDARAPHGHRRDRAGAAGATSHAPARSSSSPATVATPSDGWRWVTRTNALPASMRRPLPRRDWPIGW